MFNSEQAQKKWSALLEHSDVAPIQDNYRKSVTAVLLENQEKAMREQASHSQFMINEADVGGAADTVTGDVSRFDPTLIAMVRRAMPSLIAYDVAGVQPMTGPTGLIFAMVPLFKSDKPGDGDTGSTGLRDTAAFLNTAAERAFSGEDINNQSTVVADSDESGNNPYDGGTGGSGFAYSTSRGESLTGNYDDGSSPVKGFGSMGFRIDKASVTAGTRALRAGYTMELAQDLKALHGLDAEAELANILSTEILAEINREVIDIIDAKAETADFSAASGGTFNFADNGSVEQLQARWGQEKFQSLVFRIDQEANKIGQRTRRGKGNFVIVSPNVGSALAASGKLNYSDALTATGLNIDTVGNTFAGTLNGSIKVYVDPYETTDKVVVGYRGTNAFDAGLFYCPYVPLTMVKAVGEDDFQPRIAFKTRYGIISNPLSKADGTNVNGLGADDSNVYFRRFAVTNI